MPSLIWGIALYAILMQLGISTPYIAGTFGLGIAFIGLAFQVQLSNIFSGLSFVLRGIILFGRDLTLKTRSGPLIGRVEVIYLQFVGVRGVRGDIHFVSYSKVTGVTIHDDAYAEILVNVKENTGLYHVMDLMEEELRQLKAEHPEFEAEEFEFLEPQLLGKGCIQIQARVKTKALEQWKMRHAFSVRIHKRLKAEKVQICAAPVQVAAAAPAASC